MFAGVTHRSSAMPNPQPNTHVAQVAKSDRLVYLHPETVVSNEDIAQASVSQNAANGFDIVVELMPSGAERMRQATTRHVGHPVAVMLDGDVVITPVLRSSIGDLGVIRGEFTREEAQRIAEGITRY